MRVFLMIVASTLSASSVAAQTAAPAPIAAGDKMKCKSHVETGSLAKTVRECHTAAEWQKIAEQERNNADFYRQSMNSSRGGN